MGTMPSVWLWLLETALPPFVVVSLIFLFVFSLFGVKNKFGYFLFIVLIGCFCTSISLGGYYQVKSIIIKQTIVTPFIEIPPAVNVNNVLKSNDPLLSSLSVQEQKKVILREYCQGRVVDRKLAWWLDLDDLNGINAVALFYKYHNELNLRFKPEFNEAGGTSWANHYHQVVYPQLFGKYAVVIFGD